MSLSCPSQRDEVWGGERAPRTVRSNKAARTRKYCTRTRTCTWGPSWFIKLISGKDTNSTSRASPGPAQSNQFQIMSMHAFRLSDTQYARQRLLVEPMQTCQESVKRSIFSRGSQKYHTLRSLVKGRGAINLSSSCKMKVVLRPRRGDLWSKCRRNNSTTHGSSRSGRSRSNGNRSTIGRLND